MGAADRARARLVDGLHDSGRLCSAAVEEAFRAVPRHLFLPGVPLARAYADEAVAVQAVDGVTTSSASQPSMMAIMLEQLDLRPGHRVLEVGAGTGYNAALMARIVGPRGHVVAVDIDADLVDGAARTSPTPGWRDVELVCADGALGHPPGAPYDRIILTVGSGDVRPEWVAQLAPGGRLLLPLALRGTQLSVALDLGADGALRSASVHRCAFVRLRGVGAPPTRARPSAAACRCCRPTAASRPDSSGAALAVPGRRAAAAGAAGRRGPLGRLRDVARAHRAGTCRLLAGPVDPDDPDPDGSPPSCCRCAGPAAARAPRRRVRRAPASPPSSSTRPRTPGRGPWPVRVRAFGRRATPSPTGCSRRAPGRTPAARSGDLRLTVVPAGRRAAAGGATVVEQEHCRVLVGVRHP